MTIETKIVIILVEDTTVNLEVITIIEIVVVDTIIEITTLTIVITITPAITIIHTLIHQP
jgi:hypothetical protein